MDYDFSYINTPHIRLFLAVFPPKEIVELVRDTNRKFSKVARNFNFVPYENVHMTLQFLGNSVSLETASFLANKLQNFSGNSFKINLEDLRFGFPGQNIPEILFWQITPTQEIKSFTRELHSFVKGFDLPDLNKQKDYSKLIFHITTARVKGSTSRSFGRQVKELINNMQINEAAFTASEFCLLRSEVTKKGQTYQILSKYPLA